MSGVPTVTNIKPDTWLETAPSGSPFYSPSPTVEDIIHAMSSGDAEPLRMILCQGPRGEGKTVAALYSFLAVAERLMLEGKAALLPVRVAVIRDTFINLERPLSIDSPVLSLRGWVKAGDVSVGDAVIAGDGSATTVVAVYPQPELPLWRVCFSDGTSAVVTGGHLWALRGAWDRHHPGTRNRRCPREGWLPGGDAGGGLRITTTDLLRERLAARRTKQPAWEIPLVGPIQFESQPVPLDPYVLGVLLGDGGVSQRGVRFTTADPEILERLRSRLPAGVIVRHVCGYDYRIAAPRGRPNPVLDAIRALGLHGRKSPDKFIPDTYLWNDQDCRLELLRGLMDTDGSATPEHHASFCSTAERLIEGVEFLVRSLGGVTRPRKRTAPGDVHLYRGHLVRHLHELLQVTVQMPRGINPFTLPRKADRLTGRGRLPHRFVLRIEPAGRGRAVCFKVAHHSGLFVMNDFIVTHNTTLVSLREQVANGLPIQFEKSGHEASVTIDGREWVRLFFFGLDSREDCDNLQGFQCGILWLEEVAPAAELAVGVPSEALGLGITSIRQPGVPKRVLVTFNPPDDDHWILSVEEHLLDAGQADIIVQKYVMAAGEKSEHFRHMGLLAAQGGRSDLAEAWEQSAAEFDAYRRRNQLALESIGRYDLVKRLVEGKVGGVQMGEPITPAFDMDLHTTLEPPQLISGSLIVRGWDCGLCYDDQTEVLAEAGWKLFRDLQPADRVATRHPDTGMLEYQLPIRLVAERHVGPMLEYRSANVDFCVTPEHLVPVSRRRADSTWPLATEKVAAEVLMSHTHWRRAVHLTSNWTATDQREYGPYGWAAAVYARFMGWYLSEGCVNRMNGLVQIYQRRDRRDLATCLRMTGLRWRRIRHYGRTVGWQAYSPRLVAYLGPLGSRASEKRMPSELKVMSRRRLGGFLRAFIGGDGHVQRNGVGRRATRLAFTSSRVLADDLQEIAQKAGLRVRLQWIGPRDKQIPDPRGGVVSTRSRGGWVIRFKRAGNVSEVIKRHWRVVPYDGTRYCATVPNGTLYVRRNGIAHWNGNTPSTVWLAITPAGNIDVIGARLSINKSMAEHITEEVFPFEAKYKLTPEDVFNQFEANYDLPVPQGRVGGRRTDRRGNRVPFTFRDIGDSAAFAGNVAGPRREDTAALVIQSLMHTTYEPGPVPWSARREALSLCLRRAGATKGRRRLILIHKGECSGPKGGYLVQALNGRAKYATDMTTGRINPSVEAAKRVCVDEETEILTRGGWRRHDELAKGDWVYGYQMGSHKLVLTELLNIHRYTEPGPGLLFESGSLSMAVTPNHQCVVRRRLTNHPRTRLLPVEFVAASDLNTAHYIVRTGTVGGRPTLSDDLVRLCAWVMAEGHYPVNANASQGRPLAPRVRLVQDASANPAYVTAIDGLAARLGFQREGESLERHDGQVTWTIRGDLAAMVHLLMPEKVVTEKLWGWMTPNQLLLFLYECARGDGHWSRPNGMSGAWHAPEPPTGLFMEDRADFFHGRLVTIYQKDRAAADALHVIATLAGLSAKLRRSGAGWTVALCAHRLLTCVGALRRREITFPFCWCPETGIGTWVARRKGTVFITKNSGVYFQTLDSLAYPLAVLFPAEQWNRAIQRTAAPRAVPPRSWMGV